jgi:hypothetical protein
VAGRNLLSRAFLTAKSWDWWRQEGRGRAQLAGWLVVLVDSEDKDFHFDDTLLVYPHKSVNPKMVSA